ncbi:MAG: hypothetical protein ACQKBT_08840 [Puniceicoccales bacterium]
MKPQDLPRDPGSFYQSRKNVSGNPINLNARDLRTNPIRDQKTVNDIAKG